MAYVVKTPLSIAAWEAGPEIEINAIVTFTVARARAATMEDPGEEASAEIGRLLLTDGGGTELQCPGWLYDRLTNSDEFRHWLLSEAADRDEYARSCAAEARADERRLEA